jgi:hypothetical protein
MNDDLQDEYDEHPSLEEQLTLSLDRLHGLKTEPMSVIIVAISALYPRIFLSIVDSPACPAVYHGQTWPAQMDNLLPAELSAVLKICLH